MQLKLSSESNKQVFQVKKIIKIPQTALSSMSIFFAHLKKIFFW